MSVRKLADGKLQIDIYENGRKGKRIREVFYGTESEANLYERETKALLGIPAANSSVVAGIIGPYLEWVQNHQSGRITYREIFRSLNGPSPADLCLYIVPDIPSRSYAQWHSSNNKHHIMRVQ